MTNHDCGSCGKANSFEAELQELVGLDWDRVVTELLDGDGLALVDLPAALGHVPKHAFESARLAMDRMQALHQTKNRIVSSLSDVKDHDVDGNQKDTMDNDDVRFCPVISDTADSAHVTGYHPAASSNSLSRRYNQYRQGFVYSDGQQFDCNGIPEFRQNCSQLEMLLHTISDHVVIAIERKLQLEPGWFNDNLGPFLSSSQWHMKRYIVPNMCESVGQNVDDMNVSATSPPGEFIANASSNNEYDFNYIVLPTHTDPSLISVVIHDRPGKQNGCQGLRFCTKPKSGSLNEHDSTARPPMNWKEVPYSGHRVAVVLLGSIMPFITEGIYRATKHCVVYNEEEQKDMGRDKEYDPGNDALVPFDEDFNQQYIPHQRSDRYHRMAATLFVRPAPNALLQRIPSPLIPSATLKSNDKHLTFQQWIARVSRNYGKSKNKSSRLSYPSSSRVNEVLREAEISNVVQ